MSPEEKERRLRVVESGVKSEFWRITSEQTIYANAVAMQDVIDCHWLGEHERAKIIALQIKAKQEILKEPSAIIRNTKSLFDEWNEKSRTWVRKAKQIFSQSEKTTKRGGINA